MSRILFILPFMLTVTGLLQGLSLSVSGAEPAAEGVKPEAAESEVVEVVEVVKEKEDAAPGYLLRHRFVTGEYVHYEISDKSWLTTRKDSQVERIYNQSDVQRHYRVVSVDDQGEAVLELMIDRVRLLAQFDDAAPTVFDSSSTSEPSPKFRSLNDSIKKPMTRIRVNGRGELLSVQDLLAGQTQEADPAINFLVLFPEQEIQVGDLWKQTLEIEVPVTNTIRQPVKLLRTYQLVSVKDDIAEISLSTSLLTGVRDMAIRSRMLQQTPQGTILFNLKTQQMESRELTMGGQVVGAFGQGTLLEGRGKRLEKQLSADELQPASAENQLSQSK